MPQDAITHSDVRETTLTLVCEPCGQTSSGSALLRASEIAERLHCTKDAFVTRDGDDLVVRQFAEAHVLRKSAQMPAVHTNCDVSRRRFVAAFRAQCGVEPFPTIRTTRLRHSRVD
jgi:hypothetical protein